MAQAKASATKALTKPSSAPPPALVDTSGYADYAGDGFQNQTRDDITIPFLDILHYQCPQLDTIEGARPGMIINKGTNRLYKPDEGVLFVPCYTQHQYLEWVPKDKGGGLVNVFPLTDPLVAKARAAKRIGKYELPNGNELVETFYTYGVLVGSDGEPHTPAAIGFSSTRIKGYQAWMTHARSQVGRTAAGAQFRMPLYAYVWHLTSEKAEKNGQKWFVWRAQMFGDDVKKALLAPDHELFRLAQSTAQSVNDGAVKVDYAQQDRAAEVDAAEGGGAPVGNVPAQGNAARAPF